MKIEAYKKTGAYLLSLLLLYGNISPTFAMVKGIINGETNYFFTSRLEGENGGAVAIDQVDLGTGNIILHESMFAIEGYQATMTYNSEGVSQKASNWNRDQKQGVMGLGWEYPEDKIIRLTQQTGTMQDDKYLLYTQGSTFPLQFVTNKSGEKEYRIAQQPDWFIKHHLSTDQWRLYFPNGQIYIYGDGALTNHKSDGVEHNIKWGNWIGSSAVIEGQSKLPISYNLSAIEDIYGEQVQFFYQKHEERVGDTGLQHTRAIYLSKVKGLRGKTLEFIYGDKDSNEYYDPHTEKVVANVIDDKDAYQERYETKYLSELHLKNRNGNPLRHITFEYDFLNKNTELQKRLLTAISYKDSKGDLYKPSKQFDYFGLKEIDGVRAGLFKKDTQLYNPVNGALYAAMKQQTFPEGVSYAYHYGKQKIKGSSKEIEIRYPEEVVNATYGGVKSPWSAPELFYGSDYVVAIFESLDLTKRQSYVKVYQWIGDRWNEKDLGQFDGYFYDRYLGKDQYHKGILKQIKEKVFEAIESSAPELMGAINGFEDALKAEAKTFYKVGEDIAQEQIRQIIKDWYSGQFTVLKDIALDIAAGFEKEAEQLKMLMDGLFGNTAIQFLDHQKKLYKARDKDAAANPRKTYHITLQDKFFALTSSLGGSQVVIVQKNQLVSGEWSVKREGANLTSKYFTLDSGDNFVALLDEVTDFLYIYSWDGHIWSTYSRQLRTDFNTRILSDTDKNAIENALDTVLGSTGENAETKLDHRSSISAKNNLIVAIITDSHGVNADISLLHHDENMNWIHKGTQLNKKAAIIGNKLDLDTYKEKIPLFSSLLGKDGKLDLKTGNSFAVLQTYDNINENIPDADDIPIIGSFINDFVPDTKKINSTFGIVWDENYENIRLHHLHTAAGQRGVESFIVGDVINKIGKAHSLMVGSNNIIASENGKNYAFRYTGTRFITKELASPYYTSGFSNDVASTLVENENKTMKTPKFHQYDPNTETWGLIDNASHEEINAPEYINEVIDVSIELINIGVLVATIIIPGIGEAVAAVAETLEVINRTANVMGLASVVMEPVSKELVKDIMGTNHMGTNHKSTAISNNYISVNGKLFHRQSNGSWIEVTHDVFQLNEKTKLVGATNSIVNNFVPYTLKTETGIENHCIRLRNGKVYESKTLPTDRIVHQDSISNTIGYGAYVSYGPVNSNGFVKKNEYLDQFQPEIGESAEIRSRKNHPAYKEATVVTLHKITSESFENELYDYPVAKVSIKQGDQTYSYHHYRYDAENIAYHSSSGIAFYGKVTDIPSTKDYPINTDVPLFNTDGGYIQHFYYNRYNSFGKTSSSGYPATPQDLKLIDMDLVTYDSSYVDDNKTFEKGNITPLNGHPYASILYNSNQEIVSQDYTYYKVWERDIKHLLDGGELQVSRIYYVQPIKKINVVDGVVHKSLYTYEFVPYMNHLLLREENKIGTATGGQEEVHKTKYTYASEHYTQLQELNRLTEHFMTVKSVIKGTERELITAADLTAYDTFTINEKEILAPKNFYKSKVANNAEYYKNSTDVLNDIITNISNQDQVEISYENKVIGTLKEYVEVHKEAEFILKKENDLKNEIHQLNSEIHILTQNIDDYKKVIIENNIDVEALYAKINELGINIVSCNTSIDTKHSQIKEEEENIKKYYRNINIGWFGGLIGYGIAYGINHSYIEESKDRINSLRSGIKELKQNIKQKRNEIHTKRTELTNLINEDNILKYFIVRFETAVHNEMIAYYNLKDQLEISIIKSHEALDNCHKINVETEKHQNVIAELNTIETEKLHDDYSKALDEFKNIIKYNVILPISDDPQSSIEDYENFFQDNIKFKIETLKEKITVHKTTLSDLLKKHKEIIDFKERIVINNEYTTIPNAYQWIKTQTILFRDSETGMPIVVEDGDGTPKSVTLDQVHKKPMVTYEGVNIKGSNKKAIYSGFEQGQVQDFIGGELHSEKHTGNHSLKFKNATAIISEIVANVHTQYLVSAWIKTEKNVSTPGVFVVWNQEDFVVRNEENQKMFTASNSWQYVEALIEPGKTPLIQGYGDLLIDDLLVRPVSSNTNITIRDENDLIISNISNNGNVTKYIYDDAQRSINSIDEQGKVSGYSRHYYSRDNQEKKYTQEKPNSNLILEFQGKGIDKGDQIPTEINDVTLETTIPKTFLKKEYGISFTAKTNFTISQKQYAIERKAEVLKVTNLESGVSEDIMIGDKKNFLILDLGVYLDIYVNGELVTQLQNNEAKENDITITGTVRKLLVAQSPIPSITYMDGLSRPIQQQYLYADSNNQVQGKVVTAIQYNGWGNPIIHTKPALITDKKISYDSRFVKYDMSENKVTGRLAEFYENDTEINTTYAIDKESAPNKIFYKTEYSKDALQRVEATEQSGIVNTSENKTKIYYQNNTGTSLQQNLGIREVDRLKFATINTQKQNNDKAEVHDVFGRIIGSKNGLSLSENKYDYTPYGFKISHRLPMSFQSGEETKYTNNIEYLDLLEQGTKQFSVDEGVKYIIKNKKGLPVFVSIDNFSAEKSDLSWQYIKYDNQNRPVELGIVIIPGIFDIEKMQLLANVPLWMGDIKTTPMTTWIYDILDKNSINSKGYLTKETVNNSGVVVTTKYKYNKRGQLTVKTSKIGKKPEQSISYEYNDDGKLNIITYPNGTKIYNKYDRNGKLYGIGSAQNPFQYAKYTHGINGKVIKEEYNNKTITSTIEYTLQEHQQSNEIVNNINSTETVPLFKEKFKYLDNSNNYYDGLVVEKEETENDLQKTKWKYTYDNQYQLSVATKEQSDNRQNFNYTYDANGNLQTYQNTTNSSQNKSYTYQQGTNKLNSSTEEVNPIGLYTKIGKTFLGDNTLIEYDKLTHNISKIYTDESREGLTFTYDAKNKRVQKVYKNTINKNDTLTYTWGTRSLPLYESFVKGKNENDTSDGDWDKVYIYGADYAPIAMIYKGITYYFIRDYQSSLRYVINANTNAVEEKYGYDPYGKLSHSYRVSTQQPLGTYLYTGQEYTKEVGLYNFKARIYDPERRIFLQPDPKHINYSPYTYANNNPINFVDRNGEAPLYVLDQVEDSVAFSQLKSTGNIVVSFEDLLFNDINLPNLNALDFDGVVTIGAHGAAGNISKLSIDRGFGRFPIRRNKLASSLGKYLKKANTVEINLNLAVCYSARKVGNTSFLDEFSKSLSLHSSKTVNAVGFTEEISFTQNNGELSRVFTSGSDFDDVYIHLRNLKQRRSLDVSNNALDRSLRETTAYNATKKVNEVGLGRFGVTKTYSSKSFASKIKTFFKAK